ncbi:MAG TPA: dihydrodipicolinate synthase family protein [Terracidiphilus sp.]|jgi:4-hydroxy-2-oxoglutarate aldolase|nr:dihydrodipicolinate synthase family protein [Terracidiphilus sp.]
MLIEGVFAAITTPFYPDERIYFRKLEANLARYSRSLLAGMVVLGSTGEAVTLNDEETRDVLKVAAEATAPQKVLIAGIGQESVKSTIERADLAAQYKYDAVLVRTPTYYLSNMSVQAISGFYRSVADRSPLPVLLYNMPRCVPYDIPIEMIAELAQHPNIIGIKDSSGSLDRIQQTVAATKDTPRRTVTVTPIFEAVTARMLQPASREAESSTFVSAEGLAGGSAIATAPPQPAIKTRSREVGFQVLSGSGAIILDAMQAGASGVILGFAAPAPQACQEVYLAWKDHDLELAAEKQQRIAEASQKVAGKYGVPGVKHACEFNGYYGGYPRLPLLPLNAEQKADVEALLADIRN